MGTRAASISAQRARTAKEAGDLPIQEFQQVLRDLKERNSWKYKDMAALTGRTTSQISGLCLSRTKKTVTKALAEDILARLMGASLPPTARQQAEYTKKARRDQSDMRAETLRDNKLQERKAAVARLREHLQ